MADRNKFEEMLEKLVNEDRAGAEELFHEIVVEKSREIYENLLEDDIEVDEKADEEVDLNGVKIMGEKNILNKLPVSASNLYSKNIFNFVSNLYDKEKKSVNINLEDEIIKETLVK